MYLISGLFFYQDGGVSRAVSNVYDGAFWGIGGWFLAVTSFTVLPHYPRKIKYLQHIFKIYLKRQTSLKWKEKFV